MKEQKLWFRAKSFGWGWYPITWQGWIATIAYVLLIVMTVSEVDKNTPVQQIIKDFLVPFVLSSTLFFMLAWKTGERPTWQWGFKRKDKPSA